MASFVPEMLAGVMLRVVVVASSGGMEWTLIVRAPSVAFSVSQFASPLYKTPEKYSPAARLVKVTVPEAYCELVPLGGVSVAV